ncbi:FAD:protein FMN transferase [Pseudomaricurvus sp.]|uniref:FAD:protein FMN transferase n=1 Tax=Pseudomaricurvus sp. TaxID=2004510 RepID=UPI003F6C0180
MGTTYHITLVTDGEVTDVEQLKASVSNALAVVNRQMSTYIDDSEINRLNTQPVGEWTDVSKPLADVLGISLWVSDISEGAFDVTLRPLIDLWGFGPRKTEDNVPSDVDILDAQENVGYQYLELDSSGLRVKRNKPVNLDLSAVAKGYGVDVLAELLEYHGISNYLVEIGGEMRLKGHNPGGVPWRIAVERPDEKLMQSVFQALSLTDIGVATSGDYRNYFEKDGVRYSHTIDPRTGRPIRHYLVSVTVLNPSCAKADALATAFSVLGPQDALELANREGIAALFIIKEAGQLKEVPSEVFKPYLTEPAATADSAN